MAGSVVVTGVPAPREVRDGEMAGWLGDLLEKWGKPMVYGRYNYS